MRLEAVKPAWLAGDPRDVVPLYRKGPQEFDPRPAYIEIDLETGEVSTAVGDPGGGTPARVWHGLVQRVEVDPRIFGGALEEFLDSHEVKGLVRRVLDGARVYWDGSNRVGEVDEDGEEALEELEALAAELPTANVWTPEDWLGPALWIDYSTGVTHIGDSLITKENLEAAFRELPEVFVDDQGVHVIPGLHTHLEELAEENAARLKALEE